MSEGDFLTDVVLLALFFLLVYTALTLIMHYPELLTFFHNVLSNKVIRAILALVTLPVGMVFITLGIRYIGGLRGGGRLAVGFILTALGAALFLFAFTTIINLLWEAIVKFMKILTLIH